MFFGQASGKFHGHRHRREVTVAALTLLGDGGSAGWVWDYRCDCGLGYRVRSTTAGAIFWPEAGTGFSVRSLEAGDECLGCSKKLSLEGCTIHTPMARVSYVDH
jgi:hypothetical protein